MSRGFVKEGDQEELPVIPPRAPLPAGVANYVTPAGYRALLEEQQALETERTSLPKDNEAELRRSTMFINGKLALLMQRIQSARIIHLRDQPRDEVRFGAWVTFDHGSKEQQFQIVGVDEADVKQQKIAFTAPIARIMLGKKVGDVAIFKRGRDTLKLTIKSICYPDE